MCLVISKVVWVSWSRCPIRHFHFILFVVVFCAMYPSSPPILSVLILSVLLVAAWGLCLCGFFCWFYLFRAWFFCVFQLECSYSCLFFCLFLRYNWDLTYGHLRDFLLLMCMYGNVSFFLFPCFLFFPIRRYRAPMIACTVCMLLVRCWVSPLVYSVRRRSFFGDLFPIGVLVYIVCL